MAAAVTLGLLAESSTATEAAEEECDPDPIKDAPSTSRGALSLSSASSAEGTSEWALVSITLVVGTTGCWDDDKSRVVVGSASSPSTTVVRAGGATTATRAATATSGGATASSGFSHVCHGSEGEYDCDKEQTENLRNAHILFKYITRI